MRRDQQADSDWIDLSTGVNRRPWPTSRLPAWTWQALPTTAARHRLVVVAADWFGCDPHLVLPVPDAAAVIGALSCRLPRGRAVVMSPTSTNHAADLRVAGWKIAAVDDPRKMSGADLAVIANPNDPDGREWPSHSLAKLAAGVGHLILDESFADPRPDMSLAPGLPANVLILRSFEKFWAVAGLRLNFVIARPSLLAAIDDQAGPRSVGGPALEIAASAMADRVWARAAIEYHAEAGLRLDRLAMKAGWHLAGGTHLFRLFETPDAQAAQDALARARIRSCRFAWSQGWLRLGIPGNPQEWDRLQAAFRRLAVFPKTSG